jgi:hypothetical protein
MNTTTTAAQRLLADYEIHYPSDEAAQELIDSKAAMLEWAGRDGKYSIGDLEAVLQGHGESLQTWGDACEAEIRPHIYCSAEAVLTWLGY